MNSTIMALRRMARRVRRGKDRRRRRELSAKLEKRLGDFIARGPASGRSPRTQLISNGLFNRELPVNFCFRLDMKGAGDLFLSAADEDDIVAVFEVGEVEDVVIGWFSGEVFEENIVPVVDGDGQGAVVRVDDGDAESHFTCIGLLNGDLEGSWGSSKGQGEKKGKNCHSGE